MAPAMLMVIGIVSTIEAGIETEILGIQAQAGSFAESILASSRTVHAFGIRSRLISDFDKFLVASKKLGDKKGPLWGILFATEYAIIYAGFGLAFWQGIRMLAQGEVANSGDIFMFVEHSSILSCKTDKIVV